MARAAVLDLVLVHALRQWIEDERAAGRPATSDPAISAACAIHDSPQEQWTLSRLGETVDMSRTAFTRHFTSVVGIPPMTYLLDTIARRIGYSTGFAFAEAFRREYAVAPGRFRYLDATPGTPAARADRRRGG